MTILENGLLLRPDADPHYSPERDIHLIRQDLIAVLQETAGVRASMTECSSRRPAASKRFVVICGSLCFLLTAALVVYHDRLQHWIGRIG